MVRGAQQQHVSVDAKDGQTNANAEISSTDRCDKWMRAIGSQGKSMRMETQGAPYLCPHHGTYNHGSPDYGSQPRMEEQRPKYRFLGPYAAVRCSYLPRAPFAKRLSKHRDAWRIKRQFATYIKHRLLRIKIANYPVVFLPFFLF